jgi:hypothetical protein
MLYFSGVIAVVLLSELTSDFKQTAGLIGMCWFGTVLVSDQLKKIPRQSTGFLGAISKNPPEILSALALLSLNGWLILGSAFSSG